MSEQRDRKQFASIERYDAIRHSKARLRHQWLMGNDELAAVAGGGQSEEPAEVLDLEGEPLFYEYEVVDPEGAVVGTVRASASESIGTSLMSVKLGGRGWSLDEAFRRAESYVTDRYSAKPIRSDLVCYSWPKVGVRVTLDVPGRGEAAVIVDAADGLPVERFGADEPEGVTAYSYYREVVEPTIEKRARRWEREVEEREQLFRLAPELLEDDFVLDPSIRDRVVGRVQERSAYLLRRLWDQKVIRYGPRCSPHECFQLYAQQTNVYCAVATGQMILDFYRWYFTQDQIATAMNTDSGGTDPAGQVTGIESLTLNTMVANLDTSPTWAEAKAQIDANRPLKSGIPGHARAVAGYRRSLWGILIGSVDSDRWLRVYDPWPWNADICEGGAIVWEDWDTVTHTNWMTVRHRTTTC